MDTTSSVRVVRPGRASSPMLRLQRTGRALAWWGGHRQVRGGLLCEDGALLVVPGLVEVAESADGLWLASLAGSELTLWAYRGSQLAAVRAQQASGVHLGSHWMVSWRGTEAQATVSSTGEALVLPLGAREARARPWPDAAAASWLAGKALVEQRQGEPPRLVGVASEALRHLRVGPGGAALAWSRTQAWAHAPGGGLVPTALECPPAARCAFSPDGEQALVETTQGVCLVDLRAGQPLDDRPGGRPAGWRCWEDEQGRRHRWVVTDPAPAEVPLAPRADEGALPAPVLALGLPMDGAVVQPGGTIRCWQSGGLELELPPG